MIYNFFKKIYAASDYSAIAEGIDGFIYNTGINYEGSLGNGITSDCKISQLTKVEIEDIKDIVLAMSSQYNRTYILKNDNTLWVCGENETGQLGLGHTNDVVGFKKALDNVKCISYKYFNNKTSFVIKNDNTLWACGDNYDGQLGIPTNNEESAQLTWVQSNIDNVKEIYPADSYCLAVKNDNTLWVTGVPYTSVGDNSIGIGKNVSTQGEWIYIGNDIKKIITAYSNFVVLKNDGTLWVCGRCLSGELGIAANTVVETLTKIADNVYDFEFSGSTLIVVKNDGTLYSTGANHYGQLGLGHKNDVAGLTQFMKLDSLNDLKDIKCTTVTIHLLKSDGTLLGVGSNNEGWLGIGAKGAVYTTFTKIDNNVKNVYTSTWFPYNTFYIKNDNSLWVTGSNYDNKLGIGTTNNSCYNFIKLADDVESAIIGAYEVFVKKTNGYFYAQGNNFFERLGIKNIINNTHFIKNTQFVNSGITDYKKIYVDTYHNALYIIKNDNTLWASGANYNGELGVGHWDVVYKITKILDNVKEFYYGYYTNFALKNDGTLWAAGGNYSGEMGMSSPTESLKWISCDISPLDAPIKKLLSIDSSTYILTENNTLFVSGYNRSGQLGLGDTTNRSEFTQAMTNVKDIINVYKASSMSIMGVIKDDDTLWVAGYNSSGVAGLGLDNNEIIKSWTKLTDNVDKAWTVIRILYVLKKDGTLWVSGFNGGGQLGVGDTEDRFILTLTANNVKDVYVSLDTYFIIKKDGTLWATGFNKNGQAGTKDENNINSYMNLYKWTQVPIDFNALDIVYISCSEVGTFITLKNNMAYYAGNTGFSCSGLHPGVTKDKETINMFTIYESPSSFDNVDMNINDEVIHVINGSSSETHEGVLSDNAIYTRGNNIYGQLGLGDNVYRTDYEKIDFVNPKQISCGDNHTLVLNTNGELFATGKNSEGQLGLSDSNDRNILIKNDSVENVERIKAMDDFSVIELEDTNEILHTDPREDLGFKPYVKDN